MTEFLEKVSDASLAIDDRISFLGKWIDHGRDNLSKQGLTEALTEGKKLLSGCDKRTHLSIIHYFLANAHSALRVITARKNPPGQMSWEDEGLEQELIHLRISFSILRDTPVSEIGTDLPFRVATNLGNSLNHIGRFSEAVELWDYALAHAPSFGMAKGNRGYGLFYYAGVLYDSGHQLLFLLEAKKTIEEALKQPLEGNASKAFERTLNDINGLLKTGTDGSLKEFSLGRSRLERNYRTWVMNNRLFVNPLNDLGTRVWRPRMSSHFHPSLPLL